MLLRRVAFPDFCEPCLPSPAEKPPAGAGWLHEIKHDGFRMLVRRDGAGTRLFTRNGHDWTGRFPLIARAALSLRAVSCLIDGEAVACDDDGLPVFDRLRYRRDDRRVFPLRLRPPPRVLALERLKLVHLSRSSFLHSGASMCVWHHSATACSTSERVMPRGLGSISSITSPEGGGA